MRHAQYREIDEVTRQVIPVRPAIGVRQQLLAERIGHGQNRHIAPFDTVRRPERDARLEDQLDADG